MSKNINDTAFPTLAHEYNNYGVLAWTTYPGLTKRELFAAMAMQGFAALPNGSCPDDCMRVAVIWADALIAELAKPVKEDTHAVK